MRPLTVEEVTQISTDAGEDNNLSAQLMIAKCMVRPGVTPAQAKLLWTKQAGKVKPLIDRLRQMNGLAGVAVLAEQQEKMEATFRPELGSEV